MRQHITVSGCDIIAVDNSLPMIQRARKYLKGDQEKESVVKLLCADIRDVKIENASVVIMNLTLQFVPPAERPALIERIFKGLMPGGVLILSEKIACEDPRKQPLQQELHEEFKRAQGYSDLEISQKRAALEKVMVPETMTAHQQRLKEAGFNDMAVWFQCLNFASMIAIK
jgi:tRNA (cmo5U34)-methyltransferase